MRVNPRRKTRLSLHRLVQGEDDKDTVTVGSVVTLKVTLRRGPLLDPKKREQELRDGPKAVDKEKEEREDAEDAVQQPKRKVWEKPPKKKAKKGGKGGGKVYFCSLNRVKISYLSATCQKEADSCSTDRKRREGSGWQREWNCAKLT